MVKRLLVFFLLLMLPLSAMGKSNHPEQQPGVNPDDLPWLTGPLLTPSGHVVPLGDVNFEPYFFYTTTNGLYGPDWNSFSTPHFTEANFQGPLWFGITPWADIQFVPQASWNASQGRSELVFGDLAVALEFQLWLDTPHNSIPGVKFYIEEIFPTGPYHRGVPEKFGTDFGGDGTYRTTFGFVITRTFRLGQQNFLAARLNPLITFPTNVDVEGFSFYGGAEDTNACVKPGTFWGALLGLEYSLTRNWALALDLQGIYSNKTTFSGFEGTDPIIPIAKPSSLQFSIAPAIEYNFNASVGIIAGGWLTFAGRNTLRFHSFVIALNYYAPLHQ